MDLNNFIDTREAEGVMLTLKLQPLPDRGWRYSLFDGGNIASYKGMRLTATSESIPGAKAALAELIAEIAGEEQSQ